MEKPIEMTGSTDAERTPPNVQSFLEEIKEAVEEEETHNSESLTKTENLEKELRKNRRLLAFLPPNARISYHKNKEKKTFFPPFFIGRRRRKQNPRTSKQFKT